MSSRVTSRASTVACSTALTMVRTCARASSKCSAGMRMGRWRPLFSSTYLKTCGEAGKVGCEVTQLLTRLRWVGSDDFKCAGADDQRIDVVRGSCVNCSSRDTSGYAARRASEMVHARSRLPSGKGRWQDVLLLPHRCGPPRGGRQPGGPLRSDAATFVAPIHEYQQHGLQRSAPRNCLLGRGSRHPG